MINREALGQFARYGAIGLLSNGILYLIYLALTNIGVESKFAMSLLYALGIIQTFAFNKKWAFSHKGSLGKTFWRYCITYCSVYFVNLFVLIMLVDKAGLPHQLVMVGLILFMTMILFIAQKYWIFQKPTLHVPTEGK